MSKATTLANGALRVLKSYKEDYGSSYCTIQYIGDNFKGPLGNPSPLPKNQHQSLRFALERLYHAGAVDREQIGAGKYKYRTLIDTWSSYDPFKKVEPPDDEDEKVPSHVPSYSPPATDQNLVNANLILSKKVGDLEESIRSMARAFTLLKSEKEDTDEELAKLKAEKEAKDSHVKVLHIKRYDGKEYKLKDKVFPKVFTKIRQLAECRRNIMLVGPAGCGKSHVAKLLAEVLGLDFASISCTAGMSEAHLLGRSVPDLTHGKNRFQGTEWLRVYEEGGVGLLDELDAADPNLLLAVNTGLANGYMNVPNRPDKPRAVKSKDFVCVGTANTIGRGATRMYSGRNQLDEATLDRFRIGMVECGYDDAVEKIVCPDDGRDFIPTAQKEEDETPRKLVALGYGVRGTLKYVRHMIEQAGGGLRRIMSTRFLQDAHIMHTQAGWDLKQILEAYLEGWSREEKAKLV